MALVFAIVVRCLKRSMCVGILADQHGPGDQVTSVDMGTTQFEGFSKSILHNRTGANYPKTRQVLVASVGVSQGRSQASIPPLDAENLL